VEIFTFTKLEVFLHNWLVSIDLIKSRKPVRSSSIQSTNHRQTTRPSGNSTVKGHSFHNILESGSIRGSLCQQNHFRAKGSKACINYLSSTHSFSQPKLLAMWSRAPHFVTFSECSRKSFIDFWSITKACFRLWSERRLCTKCTIDATPKRSYLPTSFKRSDSNGTLCELRSRELVIRPIISAGTPPTSP